jgi:GxxExxY protein
LTASGLKAEEEVPLKVTFRGRVVGYFYTDILVENRLILALKAVKSLTSEHEAQLINYLKATGLKVGLLINFGKSRLEWKRMVF